MSLVYNSALTILLGTQGPTQFLAFDNGGLYSSPRSRTFNSLANDLSVAPNTYLTTTTLQQTGWYAIPGNTTYNTIYNTAEDFQDHVCDPFTFNSAGFCDQGGKNYSSLWWSGVTDFVPGKAFWWSESTGRTYWLLHEGDWWGGQMNGRELHDKIVDLKWANLTLMFEGSYNCTARGRAGGDVMHVEAAASLDFSCLGPHFFINARTS